MADNKTSNASCRDAADEADDIATPRSLRVDGLNTRASDLPVANSGTDCEPERTEVLEHVASSTPVSTTTFRRFGSVDHHKLGSPLGMARLLPDPTEQTPTATTHVNRQATSRQQTTTPTKQLDRSTICSRRRAIKLPRPWQSPPSSSAPTAQCHQAA